jgi:hypothetical protein
MAAHMDRQLKRHQIVDTSITATVDTIMQPPQVLHVQGVHQKHWNTGMKSVLNPDDTLLDSEGI